MITYTIREVTPEAITVDFEGGAWARIPVQGSWSKDQIKEIIAQYAPKPVFESVESVPFTVGETETIKTQEELTAESKAKSDAQLVGYSEMRQRNYPSIGDQLDALYWARKGDTTELDALDAQIQQIKIDYPKNMEPITRAEYQAIIDAASE